MRSLRVLVLLAVVLGLFCGSALADVKHKGMTATRDITLMEEEGANAGAAKEEKLKADELSNSGSEDFTLSLTSNRSELGDVFVIDEKIELTFKSNEDGYLTILDFTPSGSIVVLFPNKWVPDNKVAAGEEIKIPKDGQKFFMKAGGPAGTDVVKAIITNKPVSVFDETNRELVGPFGILKDVRKATRDIILVGEDEEDVKKDEKKADEPLKWDVASLAIHTKGEAETDGGFGVTVKNGWVAKIWTDKDKYLMGSSVYVRIQSNKPATLVSMVNKGSSGNENALIPEGYSHKFHAGDISVFPGGDDKWKLIATAPDGFEEVVATLKQDDGTEIAVSFKVSTIKD